MTNEFGNDETETNVVAFDGDTTLDIPVERVLKGAAQADLTRIVLIGTEPDGSLYLASNTADGPGILWLIEQAKRQVLDHGV